MIEKFSLGKSCFISEKKNKKLLQKASISGLHKLYMINQDPILHHFLFLNVQVIKKFFLVKVVQLVKINAKLLLKKLKDCLYKVYRCHQK